MFADPAVLPKDASVDAQQNVNWILKELNGQSSVRFIAGAANDYPELMKISHTTVGKGSAIRDRHLVRIESYGLTGGVKDKTIVASAYAVFDIPRVGVSSDNVYRLWTHLIGTLRGKGGLVNYGDPAVFIDKFLRGEC